MITHLSASDSNGNSIQFAHRKTI